MLNFWFDDLFWLFLAKYPAKSDIIGIIETTDCWSPTFKTGYVQLLFEKVIAFKEVKVLKLWQFFGNFYRVNCQVVFSWKTPFLESFLLKRPEPASLQNNRLNFWKCFDRFLEIFLKFNKIYSIKLEIKISTEKTGCDSCYYLQKPRFLNCTPLIYFRRETTKFLGKATFEITFLVPHQYSNFI